MIDLNWFYLRKFVRLFVFAICFSGVLALISLPLSEETVEAEHWKAVDLGIEVSDSVDYFDRTLRLRAWVGSLVPEPVEVTEDELKIQENVEYVLIGTSARGNEILALVTSESGDLKYLASGDKLENGNVVSEVKKGFVSIVPSDGTEQVELRLYKGVLDEN